MRPTWIAAGIAMMLGACAVEETRGGAPAVRAATEVAAGEYLTTVAGCNDCHTLGWMEEGAAIPVGDRLTGMPIGWRGPWGTSYPANLRLSAANMSAEQWVTMIRARNGNPPMPWMNVHAMSDGDLRAIHAFLRFLGPKGHPMPAYVPPDREPTTPFFLLVPQEASAPSHTMGATASQARPGS